MVMKPRIRGNYLYTGIVGKEHLVSGMNTRTQYFFNHGYPWVRIHRHHVFFDDLLLLKIKRSGAIKKIASNGYIGPKMLFNEIITYSNKYVNLPLSLLMAEVL